MAGVRRVSLAWIWWSIFGFVLVVILVVSLGSSSTPSLGVGDRGVLRLDGQGSILLAVDAPTFDALVKACTARDEIGLAAMLIGGSVFECDQGTQVLIIDRGMYRRRVRLLDGPQAGAAGWVPVEWVRPQ